MESYEEQHARLSKDFVWLDDDQVRNLPNEERYSYISKRKLIWDTYAMCQIIETAKKDAREKYKREINKEQIEKMIQEEEGKVRKQTYQNIKEALEDGFTVKQVIKLFKVTEEEVLNIKNNQL